MKIERLVGLIGLLLGTVHFSHAQQTQNVERNQQHWNSSGLFNTYHLTISPDAPVEYLDLDGDGDPDVLRTKTWNHIPIQWIDDDDDMKEGDLEGDLDSDCLMVDRNKDGRYGAYSDVVVDWVDNDGDDVGDIQIYAEFASEEEKDKPWGPGHFMINMDLDQDNIMNYIDWNTFDIRCWLHDGLADFFEDYHGKGLFLKIHTSPEKINDFRLNWENPFLFFDPDNDGLTEYAIRVIDNPVKGNPGDQYLTRLTGHASWISMAYDLDNDNTSGNEMDYDMTISFRGEGFNYMDQVHSFPNLRGLPESDRYFMEPRFRQLSELIYPDHDSIFDLIFSRGKWNEVYFSYDEDDDCNRWERVELYEPKNPYQSGAWQGGLDNNPQSDEVGDRGEWDLDNSGNGNLYVSKLDGKIHLYGAELGYWRIDQNAFYYQGMGGLYDGYGKGRFSKPVEHAFPIIKYSDTDDNGFFDQMEYDFDGDSIIDKKVSLPEMHLDDQSLILKTREMSYDDLVVLEKRVAEDMWTQASDAIKVAENLGINTQWYALLKHPKTIRQKYHMGYWLQFYLYMDLKEAMLQKGKSDLANKLNLAYHTSNWNLLLNNDFKNN